MRAGKMGMGFVVGLMLVGLTSPVIGQEFLPRVNLDTGGSAYGVAAGDYDGDGRLDLAVGNNALFQMTTFYGQANGSLGGATSLITPGDIPKELASADFNGDGCGDVVFNNADNIVVAYGQSNQTFANFQNLPASFYTSYIAVSDLNADGRPDVLVTDYYYDKLRVFYSQSGGAFATPHLYRLGNKPEGVAIADFDLDGYKDIAASNQYDGTVSVMYGQSDGSFARTDYPATGKPGGMVSADLNSDGRPDIAYASSSNGLGVQLGQDGGGLSAPSFFAGPSDAMDIASGDFDRDGKTDLVLVTMSTRYVTIWMGKGDGSFGDRMDLRASANGSASVTVADFDSNGWDDIAVASASGRYANVFYGIPEPASLSLLGLGGLAVLRRRRRRGCAGRCDGAKRQAMAKRHICP